MHLRLEKNHSKKQTPRSSAMTLYKSAFVINYLHEKKWIHANFPQSQAHMLALQDVKILFKTC